MQLCYLRAITYLQERSKKHYKQYRWLLINISLACFPKIESEPLLIQPPHILQIGFGAMALEPTWKTLREDQLSQYQKLHASCQGKIAINNPTLLPCLGTTTMSNSTRVSSRVQQQSLHHGDNQQPSYSTRGSLNRMELMPGTVNPAN